MILALLGLGLGLVTLPGVRRDPPERLPLHEWVPVATTALIAGLVSIGAALFLIALPTVAHAVGAAELADACHEVLAPFSSAPAALGWFSAGLASVMVVQFGRAARQARRRAWEVRAEPWLGEHQRLGDYDLVVLPTLVPVAFGVPGAPPQVVVSTGLVESVTADAFDAIVRHETAHHRLRHPRYLMLLAGAERAGFLLPVHRSVANIRHALEVWADHAAGVDPASTQSLRRALFALAGPRDRRVDDRVRRLARRIVDRPAALRALWYAPVPLMTTAAAILAIGWLVDGHQVFAMAAGCV